MLKWALTSRLNADSCKFSSSSELCSENEAKTIEEISETVGFPCLLRSADASTTDVPDSLCLLLGETRESYFVVSNENERFSLPRTFDGFFVSFDRAEENFDVFDSIRSMRNAVKNVSNEKFYFTTLKTDETNFPFRAGEIFQLVSSNFAASSHRFRSIFSTFSSSSHKSRSNNHSETVEIRSVERKETFLWKIDAPGNFVLLERNLSKGNRHRSKNELRTIFQTDFLLENKDKLPLIIELVFGRNLDEKPFSSVTVHRLVENHRRFIAFDMNNFVFVELDGQDQLGRRFLVENNESLRRYEAQLRWSMNNVELFRSQIKSMVQSADGSTSFVQTAPFPGQSSTNFDQRRNSSSAIVVQLSRETARTIFTSQPSIPLSKTKQFHTLSNFFHEESRKKNSKRLYRKDVRFCFNDTTTKSKPTIKQTSFNEQNKNEQQNETDEKHLARGQSLPVECTPL